MKAGKDSRYSIHARPLFHLGPSPTSAKTIGRFWTPCDLERASFALVTEGRASRKAIKLRAMHLRESLKTAVMVNAEQKFAILDNIQRNCTSQS